MDIFVKIHQNSLKCLFWNWLLYRGLTNVSQHFLTLRRHFCLTGPKYSDKYLQESELLSTPRWGNPSSHFLFVYVHRHHYCLHHQHWYFMILFLKVFFFIILYIITCIVYKILFNIIFDHFMFAYSRIIYLLSFGHIVVIIMQTTISSSLFLVQKLTTQPGNPYVFSSVFSFPLLPALWSPSLSHGRITVPCSPRHPFPMSNGVKYGASVNLCAPLTSDDGS